MDVIYKDTFQTGLVSWSPADSATGLFDVNTDVFYFKDWILNKIVRISFLAYLSTFQNFKLILRLN